MCATPWELFRLLGRQGREFALITIYLNGDMREIPEGLTLAALLEWLKLAPDRVAIERNREIVPRSQWEAIAVIAGDHLEIVHFVGGGAGSRTEICIPR